VSDLDFHGFDALTFDCYGTLIDWEAGILTGLRRVLDPHAVAATDDELLEAYARAEADLEAGPYRRYREVLGEGLRRVARRHGVEPTPDEVAAFGGSVGEWPAFPDSAAALARLAKRFRLGVITNCDDDLFALSSRIRGTSRSRSSGSGCRRGASCTWPRACSTTTCRRGGSASPAHG
jgi:2-haloacid dehalogenase